jgi:Zn-dependent protease with chaperone function
MYIENPFGGEDSEPSFLDKLFMTHPPTSERVEALMDQQ